MDKMDFFERENSTQGTDITYIIIKEPITMVDNHYEFVNLRTEDRVITELADITNDKHFRIHKILMMNERGEVAEIEVKFTAGRINLFLAEGGESIGVQSEKRRLV